MTTIQSFVFSPFSENTYVLYDESLEAIIIDPGCLAQHEKETLATFIAEKELKIKYLLLTHGHLDHVFGCEFVKRKYGVHAYLHEADMPIFDEIENRCKLWGIPGYEPTRIDKHIKEGDIFTFGDTTLETIFVPGHAPGHVAFVNHKEKFIIGGDVLFQGSIGRTDLPLGNHAQLIESIKNKFLTLPDDYSVYSGHGEETTIGEERKHNRFLR